MSYSLKDLSKLSRCQIGACDLGSHCFLIHATAAHISALPTSHPLVLIATPGDLIHAAAARIHLVLSTASRPPCCSADPWFLTLSSIRVTSLPLIAHYLPGLAFTTSWRRIQCLVRATKSFSGCDRNSSFRVDIAGVPCELLRGRVAGLQQLKRQSGTKKSASNPVCGRILQSVRHASVELYAWSRKMAMAQSFFWKTTRAHLPGPDTRPSGTFRLWQSVI